MLTDNTETPETASLNPEREVSETTSPKREKPETTPLNPEGDIAEADILNIIAEVSSFFSLPKPRTSSRGDALAEITPGDGSAPCQLQYSAAGLQSIGLRDRETLTLCFVHELTHQALHGYRFMLFSSERWMHELAADTAVGLYAASHGLPACGYKRAVAQQAPSATHPDGRLRERAVDHGMQCLRRGDMDGKALVKAVTDSMPMLVHACRDSLRRDWRNLLKETGLLASPPRKNGSGEPSDDRLLTPQTQKPINKHKEKG